jgi:cyclophilin family peptidyl-prolyl cis-trans isomerase
MASGNNLPNSKRVLLIRQAYHWYLATVFVLLAVVSLLAAQGDTYAPSGPKIQVTLANHRSFIITTDKVHSPKTVRAVLELIKSGFYDGVRFHRVQRWIVQWGDPQSRILSLSDPRIGSRGSGITLPLEDTRIRFYRGVVGIASPATGSLGNGQLFILRKDTMRLNGGYGILGKVTSGMDVVDSIKLGDVIRRMRVLKKKSPL